MPKIVPARAPDDPREALGRLRLALSSVPADSPAAAAYRAAITRCERALIDPAAAFAGMAGRKG